MSTFIIGGCDCFESFLSSSVPNLHFDLFTLHFKGPNLKINPNSWQEGITKDLIRKSK